MSAEENLIVSTLCAYFRWDDSLECRFHALVILRKARKEPAPLWDDFKAGVT